MRARDQVLQVAWEWISKAESDLKNAVHTLKLGSKCPTDTVCFHAQQCVEKYLKALLVLKGIDFPKTHDIKVLLAQLPASTDPALTVEEQERLTAYATGPRYPGWPEISLDEAKRAVVLARRCRKQIRAFLPKALLRRRKS